MSEKKKQIDRFNIALMAVTAMTVILRGFYVYYTPHWIRQHDVIGFGADEGQAAFIEYFYRGNFLIDFDPRTKWGFFQPPLHHMLSALWIHLQQLIGIGYDTACENVQILTLLFSLGTLFFSYKIFKALKLIGRQMLLAYTIAAIHPGFILMAGSVNNDMLAILFSIAIMYTGLLWIDDPSWKNTILLALLFGFGMMTKLSVGLLAPAVALIFVIKMIKGGVTELGRWIAKYVSFLVICAPVALWSPLRNHILFGVPFNYTPVVGEPADRSLAERIFDIRVYIPYVSNMDHGDAFYEFNIFTGMMKYSLFGDENFAQTLAEAGHAGMGYNVMMILGWGLLISAFILACLCLYSTVRVLLTDRYIESGIKRLYIGAIYVVSVIMYVSFMIGSAYSSSMDFRYVLYLIPLEAAMAGLYEGKAGRIFSVVTVSVTVFFAIDTLLLYIFLTRG